MQKGRPRGESVRTLVVTHSDLKSVSRSHVRGCGRIQFWQLRTILENWLAERNFPEQENPGCMNGSPN